MKQDDLIKLQHAILYIAIEVDKICAQNNIHYSVDGGTMIGIIRHKGFIPWDDDFDIRMLREDYDRFVEICERMKSDQFELVTWNNHQNYYHGHAKFMLKGSNVMQKKHATSDEPQGVFIDIFPFDNAPQNKFLQKKQKWVTYYYTKLMIIRGGFDEGQLSVVKRIGKWILRSLSRNLTHDDIVSKMERNLRKYDGKDTGLVACMIGSIKGYERTLSPTKYHREVEKMPFENAWFNCSKYYDALLKQQYVDYMRIPPKEQQVSHDIISIKLPTYLE